MNSTKQIISMVVFGVVVWGLFQPLNAAYYQDTLFPIGLTGLNPADHDATLCPYRAVNQFWDWDEEEELIDSLGINCLGSQDALPTYLIDLNPDTSYTNNYLNKAYKEDIDKNITFKYTKSNL